MNNLVSIVFEVFNSLFRHVYWIYRIARISTGKNVVFKWPVIVEGSGKIAISNSCVVERNAVIRVGDGGSVQVGSGAVLSNNSLLAVSKESKISIGDHFRLGAFSRLYVHANWSLGDNVTIANNCQLFSREPYCYGSLNIGNESGIGDNTVIDLSDTVTIGSNVAVGPNCTFYTHDHNYQEIDLIAPWKGSPKRKPIVIEDGAWIGSNVIILPGIIVGKNSIIGAGSVVTKNIESNGIYAGNPARLLKMNETRYRS